MSNVIELPYTGPGGTVTSDQAPPYQKGAIARLTCANGYGLPDPDQAIVVATDQGHLAWEPAELHCIPVLDTLPDTEKGGSLIASRPAPPYQLGDTVQLHCSDGYLPPTNKTATLVMEQGVLKWQPSSLNCHPVQCLPPASPDYGYVDPKVFTFPKFFSYHCYEGYRLRIVTKDKLDTKNKYFCLSTGEWNPSLPDKVSCLPVECPPLTAPKHGSMSVYTRTFGSIVTFRCKKGYAMVQGESQRVCQSDGTWSGDDVVCDTPPGLCPPLAPPLFVKTTVTTKSQVSMECADGKYVTVKCLPSGQWSMVPPFCSDPGPPPPPQVKAKPPQVKVKPPQVKAKPPQSRPVKNAFKRWWWGSILILVVCVLLSGFWLRWR